MSVGEHRCPACGEAVVEAHQCMSEWEEPDYGIKGFETTRCEVVDGVMSVSISGGTDMSGAGAVLALGDEAADAWFSGLDSDDDDGLCPGCEKPPPRSYCWHPDHEVECPLGFVDHAGPAGSQPGGW